MSRAATRLVTFAAAVCVVACVEIAAGPDGVISISLTPPPKAIVLGDTLRDSTGAVLRLRPVGYGESGAALTDLPFVFTPLAIGIDTVNGKPVALKADSGSRLVIAPTTWLDDSGRVAFTLGNRLQIVDTFVIVPRPARLTRSDSTLRTRPDTSTLFFDCRDDGTILSQNQLDTAVQVYKGVTFGNIKSLTTRLLTGDSTGKAIPVRRYLVQYAIETFGGKPATSIPMVTLKSGAKLPAIGLVSRNASVTTTPAAPINFDTTDALGTTAPRLRFFPTALTDTLIPVVIRVVARTSTTARVVDSAVVNLRRFVRNPADGAPISCPTP